MRFTILVLTLLLALSQVGYAYDEKEERDTLVGLRAIFPVLSLAETEANLSAANEDALKRDVELQLRKAGITIWSKDEPVEPSSMLVVAVQVMGTGNKNLTGLFFAINVEAYQRATLARDPSMTRTMGTWSIRNAGRGDEEYLRTLVRDAVDKFVLAYLTANPRK